MLRLIPAPLFRQALRVAHKVRHHWRKCRGVTPHGVCVIARDLEGQVLLVQHSYGPPGWYIPGGGLKRGEDPADAARRELREETGCEIDGLKPLGEVHETLSGAPHMAHVFTGVVDDIPKPDGREVVEARFFPTHSLPEPLAPSARRRLEVYTRRCS